MIVRIEDLKKEKEFADIDDAKLKRKLKAIEKSIRSYTNNKFIDPRIRDLGQIKDNAITTKLAEILNTGDNIELTHCLNDGPYTIKSIESDKIMIEEDTQLLDDPKIIITKIIYPEDVQEGVINLFKWDLGLRNKVGIKSETISRHSVTYFDMDKTNSLKGYPASLLGFLDDYIKARF